MARRSSSGRQRRFTSRRALPLLGKLDRGETDLYHVLTDYRVLHSCAGLRRP